MQYLYFGVLPKYMSRHIMTGTWHGLGGASGHIKVSEFFPLSHRIKGNYVVNWTDMLIIIIMYAGENINMLRFCYVPAALHCQENINLNISFLSPPASVLTYHFCLYYCLEMWVFFVNHLGGSRKPHPQNAIILHNEWWIITACPHKIRGGRETNLIIITAHPV